MTEESSTIFLINGYKVEVGYFAGRPGFKHDWKMATPCQFKQQPTNKISNNV